MKPIIILSVITLLFFTSCKVEPAEINYGKEGCHFCKMTIVDRQHASEIVTTKGKAFKYDAIECMINDFKNRDEVTIELLLVNDYSNPGTLISAESATFLISEGVPSPMGAFLSAFSNTDDAESIRAAKGGSVFTWQKVQSQID